MILQGHKIKGSWIKALWFKSPPCQVDHHRHCDSGDARFLVVEEQDSTCSLKSAITIYFWSTWHESLWHIMLSTGYMRLGQY